MDRSLRRLRDYPHQTLALLFALCSFVYVATIPLPRIDGMLIGSDGVGYYMYVRSLVLDRDLDFANEYARLYPDADLTAGRTATGLLPNQYAIGPGLLWMPFFVGAHGLVLGLRFLGVPVAADGYSYPYQAAICYGSILFGFLGMLLIYQPTKRLYPRTALAAVLLTWLATNFIYYMIVEPSMSHMCSLFAAALLNFVWLRGRATFSLRECLVIGLAGGLVGVVRQPDATLLALPIVDCLLSGSMVRRVQRIGVILVGFLLVFWIQMLAWQVLNGNPFMSGYFKDAKQGFAWLAPHLGEVLFSTEHGLFLWHPILLFAAAGLIFLGRTDRKLALLFTGGLLLQAYLISTWSAWSQGDAFGGRMFIASLPMLTIGLAATLEWAAARGASPVAWVVGVCLIGWNALFLVQYRLGFIPMSGPYTFQQLTVGKLDMLAQMVRRGMQLATELYSRR